MLQAESSYARDWNVYELPPKAPRSREFPSNSTNQPSPSIASRTAYKVNYRRKLLIKSACIVFAYALILVFLCMKSATMGYQIEKLEVDVNNMETANHRLDYQIAEKSSLSRVEQIATSQLGMYKPESQSSLALDVKTEPVKVAIASSSTDENSLSQRLLNRMYSSLSHLAQNGN